MSDPLAIIKTAWGETAPDWLECLARECANTSQRKVAEKLKRSGAGI